MDFSGINKYLNRILLGILGVVFLMVLILWIYSATSPDHSVCLDNPTDESWVVNVGGTEMEIGPYEFVNNFPVSADPFRVVVMNSDGQITRDTIIQVPKAKDVPNDLILNITGSHYFLRHKLFSMSGGGDNPDVRKVEFKGYTFWDDVEIISSKQFVIDPESFSYSLYEDYPKSVMITSNSRKVTKLYRERDYAGDYLKEKGEKAYYPPLTEIIYNRGSGSILRIRNHRKFQMEEEIYYRESQEGNNIMPADFADRYPSNVKVD